MRHCNHTARGSLAPAWARRATLYAVVVLAALPGAAERLLACTTTLSATREAARVYLHSIETEIEEAVLPGEEVLPGVVPLTPILLTPDYRGAVIVSGHPSGGTAFVADERTCISAYRTSPFSLASWGGRIRSASGWRQAAACFAAYPSSPEPILVVVESQRDEDGVWRGRIELPGCGADGNAGSGAGAVTWPLPAAPVAVATLSDGVRVAVLCRGPSGMGAVLHVRNVWTGAADVESLDIADDRDPFSASPEGLCLTNNGKWLFVLTSGFALNRPSGEPVSWVRAVNATSFTVPFPAMELPGVAHVEDVPLHAADACSCWIATVTPGAQFAYAIRVRAGSEGLVKEVQIPFTGVSRPLRIAPAREGDALAVGVENRIEVWAAGRRNGQSERFEGAIAALQWGRTGLLAGEGGRIHQIDPTTLVPCRTVQLQTGHVSSIAIISDSALAEPDSDADGLADEDEARRGTDLNSPDTDRDGIPDAVDPEPTVPSPWVVVPEAIAFRGDAVGRELRALLIDFPYGGQSPWRIDYGKAAVPWLHVLPQTGTGLPDVAYLWVDPVRYAYGETVPGTLELSVGGAGPETTAFGSPATIQVSVTPRRGGVRRILWVWNEDPARRSIRDADDPRKLRSLAEMLAGPPHYFTHRDVAGPFLEGLDAYTIVVIEARAAAGGALTGQAVLDYVARGGALLFLGAYLPDQETWTLSRWLSPAGIQINTGTQVEGVFPRGAAANGLCRHWVDVGIAGGCGIRAEAQAVLAGTPDQTIFAARPYGYGRVAALASGTPLDTSSLEAVESRLFAQDLFLWLARAGRDFEDRDGDGLTDDIEDRDGNGEWNAGESDPLRPDTDGDGIPDGMEDRNRNGRVDPGETDPLNPDSDGDGVLDGADVWPLPPAEAPQVAAVEPRQGPAEGGTAVVVVGRNLTPGATFWFGDRLARTLEHPDDTRVRVETPRYDGSPGDTVDVRVRNEAASLEGVLPKAFRYGQRTRVRLSLHSLSAVAKQYDVYEGSLLAAVECPPDIALDVVLFRVNVEPAATVQWGEFTVSASASDRGVTCTRQGAAIWLHARGGRGGTELAVLGWRLPLQVEWPETLSFSIERAYVTAANGQPLAVDTANAQVRLMPRTRRPHRE